MTYLMWVFYYNQNTTVTVQYFQDFNHVKDNNQSENLALWASLSPGWSPWKERCPSQGPPWSPGWWPWKAGGTGTCGWTWERWTCGRCQRLVCSSASWWRPPCSHGPSWFRTPPPPRRCGCCWGEPSEQTIASRLEPWLRGANHSNTVTALDFRHINQVTLEEEAME